MSYQLTFSIINGSFGVCRLDKEAGIPAWAYSGDFFSITKTLDELSIVCTQEVIPHDIRCEGDWKILKVDGILDFALIGILASISTTLAQNNISIFAVSTFDTDYILIKDKDFTVAVDALKKAGHIINKA